MTTPPSPSLIVDLQIAIERLARTSTVMNLALQDGFPLRLLPTVVKPVLDSAQKVTNLIEQAISVGVDLDALRAQIDQPLRDSLAELLADAVNLQVPDTLEGL